MGIVSVTPSTRASANMIQNIVTGSAPPTPIAMTLSTITARNMRALSVFWPG